MDLQGEHRSFMGFLVMIFEESDLKYGFWWWNGTGSEVDDLKLN